MSAASNKWILAFGPETLLDDAAKIVLAGRLETLATFIHRVIEHSQQDPEDVHQLRVAARRATASLDEFAPCLPSAMLNELRDRIRRLRRSAGEARDWDVFAAMVQTEREQASDGEIAGIDYLLGYVQGHRAAAHQALEEACAEVGAADFKRLVRRALKSVRLPRDGPKTALGLAHTTLASRIEEFLSATGTDCSDYKLLHQVRIQGKRLRYAMEFFASCCDPHRWSEVYGQLAESQETLGKANDRHVASKKLDDLRESLKRTDPIEWRRVKAGILGLLKDQREGRRRESKRSRAMVERWQQLDQPRLIRDLLLPSA